MINFEKLRKIKPSIAIIGSYPVVQSILDYDFMIGRNEPSIKYIIANGKNFQKNFFGDKEILIPVYSHFSKVPEYLKESTNLFLNLSSGRRCYESSMDALNNLPNILGGVIFAEETPERFTIQLSEKAKERGIFIIGPSSIGILLPGFLKLGAIGGVTYQQLIDSKLSERGKIAVFSASGGMTNELLRVIGDSKNAVSASLSFGGDRFPIISPKDALIAAEMDKETEVIIYFGELGGYDEYEIGELIKQGKIKKKVIAYIAGVIGDAFDKPTQFGHAKAMAKFTDERAISKRKYLRDLGVVCPDSFHDFVKEVNSIDEYESENSFFDIEKLRNRGNTIISSTISRDVDGEPYLFGEKIVDIASNYSIEKTIISSLLGKKIKSNRLERFFSQVYKLAIDHGPLVSGAMNTIVSSRAGKDMASSVASGLLTIGDRFGGAINIAAQNWLNAIIEEIEPIEFVENFARRKKYILGIGHKKYRIDLPDPRVSALKQILSDMNNTRFLDFALEVEKITTMKKGNLILNFDGAVAACILDILHEEEDYDYGDLQKLIDIEFFNSLFILPRLVGFASHFLDQKRIDEGLFRLDRKYLLEV